MEGVSVASLRFRHHGQMNKRLEKINATSAPPKHLKHGSSQGTTMGKRLHADAIPRSNLYELYLLLEKAQWPGGLQSIP
jgi:hypothetical protein